MSKAKSISFRVDDELLGNKISPSNISIALLNEFTDQVTAFLRGSKHVDLKEVKVSVDQGSLVLTVSDEVGIVEDAFDDYETAFKEKSLENIDERRAQIFEIWQNLASTNDNRVYELFNTDNAKKISSITIDQDTKFKKKKSSWVNVELYVYGKINDIGGKNKPNIHLELENGSTVKIGSSKELLSFDRENRIYKRQLVRISAKQNIDTKEIKDEKLLSFEHYSPNYDEEEFLKIVSKGRLAWRSVKNATKWVEELRGSSVRA
jgi:hypothetical protein